MQIFRPKRSLVRPETKQNKFGQNMGQYYKTFFRSSDRFGGCSEEKKQQTKIAKSYIMKKLSAIFSSLSAKYVRRSKKVL